MLDLLIVNAHSDEFFYVPVGSVAICSWLRRHGFSAAVLNLACVGHDEVASTLESALREHQPRMVGLVLHWKETLNAIIAVGDAIQRLCPQTPIVAGGLTASCDPSGWLERLEFLTCVVQGDAEVPLLELCRGSEPARIPNLWSRVGTTLREPSSFWAADGLFLDGLDYGDLGVMLHPGAYTQRINTRLGLPLAPGRGCVHDCGYCGGSREAFELHSHRGKMALRRPQRVVEDIEAALAHGQQNFLLSHLPTPCMRILQAVADRFGRTPAFTVNLEIWGIPTQECMDAYAWFRWPDSAHGRFLLLTARGDADAARHEAERNTLVQLACAATEQDPQLYATLFSGYFAPWHADRERLQDDLRFSVELRRRMMREGRRITLSFMALSTDPHSTWLRSADALGLVADASLAALTRGGHDVGSVINNLLLHAPRQLSAQDREDFLRCWHLDDRLQTSALAAWCLLVDATSLREYLDLLRDAAASLYFERHGTVYPATGGDPRELLAACRAAVDKRLQGPRRDMLKAALTLLLAELRAGRSQGTGRDVLPAALPARLALDPDAVLESPFDLGPLLDAQAPSPIAQRLDACAAGACAGRGYLLRPKRSQVLPPSEMALLQRFDGLTRTDDVIDGLTKELGAPHEAVWARVAGLVRDRVLLGSAVGAR